MLIALIIEGEKKPKKQEKGRGEEWKETFGSDG
jgi:hypothetical protein